VLRLLFSHDIFAALFWAAAADGGRGSAGQFGLVSINCAAILGVFCLVFWILFAWQWHKLQLILLLLLLLASYRLAIGKLADAVPGRKLAATAPSAKIQT